MPIPKLLSAKNVAILVPNHDPVPVIMLVVDPTQTSTSAEFNSAARAACAGMVGISIPYCARTTGAGPDMVSGMTASAVTMGDDTGFKILRSSINATGANGYYGSGYINIYYKGTMVSYANCYSGYTNYEYAWPCLIVDTNNALYTGGNSVAMCLHTGPSTNGGPAKVGSEYYTTAFTVSGRTWDTLSAITGTKVAEDISEDIYDPFEDPYAPGGTSGPGGGGGGFDFTGDTETTDPLPTLSAVDTGFITLFKPTIAELKGLAGFMWNDLDLDNFTRIFNDPMDVILGLSVVPLQSSDIPSGGIKSVVMGNIVQTALTMDTCASQWVLIDCGTVDIAEQYNAYLDYSPFTKAEIYLPFIGYRAISTDDIMGKTISLEYKFDVLSGGCVAIVHCGDNILYQFIGESAVSIPITGGDWTNVVNGMLSIATAIGAVVATQGAALPFVAGQAINGASQMSKPEVERSGAVSGAGGILAQKTPMIVMTRPNQCLPKEQNKYVGYPSLITRNLGELTGYTEIEEIHLSGLATATEDELQEIYSLLKGGVIL